MKHFLIAMLMVANIATADVIELSSKQQLDSLLKENGSTLLMFHAHYCGYCRKSYPIVEKVANENNIVVVKIDVEKFPSLSQKWTGRKGIPEYVAVTHFNDKTTTVKSIGFMSEVDLTTFINEHM